MKILEKFRSNFHSFDQVLLFLKIFCMTPILHFLMRFLTLPRLMKVITPPKKKQLYNNHDREQAKDTIVKFTDYLLSRNILLYKRTCLRRSLVLFYFLRRIGIDVHICFGVRNRKDVIDTDSKQKLEGHAWLMYDGDIFLEKNTDMTNTYTKTYCYPERYE